MRPGVLLEEASLGVRRMCVDSRWAYVNLGHNEVLVPYHIYVLGGFNFVMQVFPVVLFDRLKVFIAVNVSVTVCFSIHHGNS